MSSSTECSELSNQTPAARFPERPNFSQTCSMLSRYLKEKGSFGDLSLGLTRTGDADGAFASPLQPTTMNLFPCEVSSEDMKSKDLFPSQSGLLSSPPKEIANKVTDSSSANQETQTAQMTIFYAGHIMVFNDFPADKAKEIMNLASSESAKNYMQIQNNQGALSPNLAKNQNESISPFPPKLNPVPSSGKNLNHELAQPSSARIASDLPIARRASLHRFLEKRKDRITARAPYQMNEQDTAASKPTESSSWLGLAAHPPSS